MPSNCIFYFCHQYNVQHLLLKCCWQGKWFSFHWVCAWHPQSEGYGRHKGCSSRLLSAAQQRWPSNCIMALPTRLCPFSPSPMLYSIYQICLIYGYGDFGSCRALFCTHHTGNWGTEIMKTWWKNRARQRTSPLFFLHLPPSPPNVVIPKEEGESKPRGC